MHCSICFTFQKCQRGQMFSPFPPTGGFFPVSTNSAHSYKDLFIVALTPHLCLHSHCVSFLSSLLLILHLLLQIFSLPFSALIHASEGWALQTGQPGSLVLDFWIDFASGRHGQEISVWKVKETEFMLHYPAPSTWHDCGCIPELQLLSVALVPRLCSLWALGTPCPLFAPSGLELVTAFFHWFLFP